MCDEVRDLANMVIAVDRDLAWDELRDCGSNLVIEDRSDSESIVVIEDLSASEMLLRN